MSDYQENDQHPRESHMAPADRTCHFLNLPTELRILIYDFALCGSEIVTLGTTKLTGKSPDLVHRLYSGNRLPHPELPANHEPTVVYGYSSPLLSNSLKSNTHVTADTPLPPIRSHENTHLNLLLLCRTVKQELEQHMRLETTRGTDVFASFPDGLHVFRSLTPHLIPQLRSLHIAGTYDKAHEFSQRLYANAMRRPSLEAVHFYGATTSSDIVPPSIQALKHLINSVVDQTTGVLQISQLTLRIYYPGPNSYSRTVWSDDLSPVAVALGCLGYGDINLSISRWNVGTGVSLIARPNASSEEGVSAKETEENNDQPSNPTNRGGGEVSRKLQRVISTFWSPNEGGAPRNQDPSREWIVDPQWPEWGEKKDAQASDASGST